MPTEQSQSSSACAFVSFGTLAQELIVSDGSAVPAGGKMRLIRQSGTRQLLVARCTYHDATMGLDLNRIPPDAISEFCRKHHIRRLAVFGSALRRDFAPDSDLDLLVEFETGKTPGLAFFTIQRALSEMFGRKVDLHTPRGLSKYFRDEVLRDAKDLYVAA